MSHKALKLGPIELRSIYAQPDVRGVRCKVCGQLNYRDSISCGKCGIAKSINMFDEENEIKFIEQPRKIFFAITIKDMLAKISKSMCIPSKLLRHKKSEVQ